MFELEVEGCKVRYEGHYMPPVFVGGLLEYPEELEVDLRDWDSKDEATFEELFGEIWFDEVTEVCFQDFIKNQRWEEGFYDL